MTKPQVITLYKVTAGGKEKGKEGFSPADLNHFHFQRSHHSYYKSQLTPSPTASGWSSKKRAPLAGQMFTNVHEESYFRVGDVPRCRLPTAKSTAANRALGMAQSMTY